MDQDLIIDIAFAKINSAMRDIQAFQKSVEGAMGGVSGSVQKTQGAFTSLRNEVPLLDKAFRLLKNPIVAAVGALTLLGGQMSASVDTARQFEKGITDAFAIIGSGLDASEAVEQFDLLQAKALEIGSSTEFSATQAAAGMEFLGRAGFSTNEILKSTSDFLGLATVENLELARAADIGSNVMRQFGIDAQESGRVVDVLAKTATSANTDIVQLGEAFKYIGPTFKALGVSIEETAAVVGKLGDAGIQGSLAGRALGTSFARLAQPTKRMQEAIDGLPVGLEIFNKQTGQFVGVSSIIDQLGTNFETLNDKQRQAFIQTVFGAEAMQEINILLDEGADSLRSYTSEIEAAGAQQGQFSQSIRETKLDTLEGSVTLLNSALEGLQIAVGSAVTPALKEFNLILADGINAITNFINESGGIAGIFQNIGATISENVDVLVLLGSAYLALRAKTIAASLANLRYEVGFLRLVALEKASVASSRAIAASKAAYSTVVGVLSGKIRILSVVTAAYNAILAINPIALVIIAVGALTAGFIKLYKESQTFRAIIAGLWNVIQVGVDRFKALYQESLLFRVAVTALTGPIGAIVQSFFAIKNVLPDVVSFFRELNLSSIDLKTIIVSILDPLGIFRNFLDGVGVSVSSLIQPFKSFGNAIFDALDKANEAISKFFGFDVGEAIKNLILFPFNALKSAFSFLGGDIVDAFTEGFNKKIESENLAAKVEQQINDASGEATIRLAIQDIDSKSERTISQLDKAISTLREELENTKPNTKAFDDLSSAVSRGEKRIQDLRNAANSVNAPVLTPVVNNTKAIKQLNELSDVTDIFNMDKEASDFEAAAGSIELLKNRVTELNSVINKASPDSPVMEALIDKSRQAQSELDRAEQKLELLRLGISDDFSVNPITVPVSYDRETIGELRQRVEGLNSLISQSGVQSPVLDSLVEQSKEAQLELDKAEKNLLLLKNGLATDFEVEPISIPIAYEEARIKELQARIEILNTSINNSNPNNPAIDSLIEQSQIAQKELIEAEENLVALQNTAARDIRVDPISFGISYDSASIETLRERVSKLNAVIAKTNSDSPTLEVLVQKSKEAQLELDKAERKLEFLRVGLTRDFKVDPITIPVSYSDPVFPDPEQPDAITIPVKVGEIAIPEISLATIQAPTIDTTSLSNYQQALFDLGVIIPDTSDKNVQLAETARALGVDMGFATNSFSNYQELLSAANSSTTRFFESLGANKEKALELAASFQELKANIQDTLVNGVGGAFEQFGKDLGQAIAEGKKGTDALANLFRNLLRVLLVDVPKLAGIFLLQTAVGLGFPAGVPAFAAGLALLALSGIAAGVLKGQEEKQSNQASLPGSPDNIQSAVPRGGLGGQDNGGLQPTVNITLTNVMDADGILTELERRNLNNLQLTEGK